MRRRSALRHRYGRAARKAGGDFAIDKSKIQTLLFPRSEWAIQDALLWAHADGAPTKHYDVTESHIRVFPKGKKPKAKHVRTIPYGIQGVRAVMEWR